MVVKDERVICDIVSSNEFLALLPLGVDFIYFLWNTMSVCVGVCMLYIMRTGVRICVSMCHSGTYINAHNSIC